MFSGQTKPWVTVEVRIMRWIPSAIVLAILLGMVGLTDPAAGQAGKDKAKFKTGTSAVFEVYQDTQKDFRFRLVDNDGTKLAMSTHGYDTKAEVMHVIDEIRRLASKAKIEEAPPKK
jgi:uncharacterized protein YegP (UPF0339 family)